MKKSVIDIHDLQKMAPIFKGPLERVGKWLLRIFCIEKVNKVHEKHCDLRGAAFTSALLSDPMIDIRYEIHNKEILDSLPEGSFITVSNHPIGSIDGIILIDIFASRRPDFKVMVNGVLTNIGAMEDNFISVRPDSEKTGKMNPANLNGIRDSISWIQNGHPMGFFPAGAISFYNPMTKQIHDLSWAHSVIRLIEKGNVPVYPVFFDFYNTVFFYLLGRISWKIRTLRIPAEAFNKKGKTAHVYIGKPISPEEISQFGKDKDALAKFLCERTYGAKK